MSKCPILFFSYARSGGTVMNKCLLNLSNTIVLSEINPNEFGEGLWKKRPSIHEIVQLQAKKWYGIKLQSTSFDDAVLELINYCFKNNIRLIIRDFSIADFVSSPLLKNQPQNKLSWVKWMKKHQINYQSFSLIRHPMPMWISHQMPAVNDFISAYTNYLKELKQHNIKCFFYETFTRQPEAELNQILKHLNITEKSTNLLAIEGKNNLFGDLKKPVQQQLSEIKFKAEKPIPFWKWKKATKRMKNEPVFADFFEFQSSKSIKKLIFNTIRYYRNKLSRII